MNIHLPIVGSPSRLEVRERCERRGFVANVLNLQPADAVESSALTFGTAVHAGAAVWWSRGLEDEALLAAHEALGENVDARHSHDLLDLTMRRYMQEAKRCGPIFDDSGFELLACEDRVLAEGVTHTLSFQVDRLYARDDKTAVLIDTKTAARLDKRWHARWDMSLQQKLYAHIVQQHYGVRLVGHFIEGVLKDVPSRLEYVALPEWDDATLQEARDLLERRCQEDAAMVARYMQQDGLDEAGLLFAAVTQTAWNPADCMAYGQPCPLLNICKAPLASRAALLGAGFTYVPPTFLE